MYFTTLKYYDVKVQMFNGERLQISHYIWQLTKKSLLYNVFDFDRGDNIHPLSGLEHSHFINETVLILLSSVLMVLYFT